ncbi:MAG: HigA family addiction module antitoxin [Nitrospirae bacterium]|nr:HigA family addiction module antitoxin [Nitrospirota bacterium]MDA1303847.1 HigA family addiction module antitoxin [Nitrospirota bacterium]
MTMHNPLHPGETILEDCIKAVGWTVTETAKALGLSRAMLSRICHGHAPVTPDVAVRLERVFPPSAESWLALQQSYDLWQVRKEKIKRLRKAPRVALAEARL